MEIGPSDAPPGRAARKAPQPEAAQHRVEPDFHAHDLEQTPGWTQVDVTDAHDPMAGEIHDLGVEHVAGEEDRFYDGLELGAGLEANAIAVDARDRAPRRPRRRLAAPPHDHPGHHGDRRPGGGADIGDLADDVPTLDDRRAHERGEVHVSGAAVRRSHTAGTTAARERSVPC